ncbi:hypothetical protein ABZS66_60075 [Dactylosporangium sp. NPDC005572]|uniref:hypothetical protein n=1 Tax=Dactylosporangium sp. NPDC005572 TaxID=3156889 RepID=UPI0033B1F9BC
MADRDSGPAAPAPVVAGPADDRPLLHRLVMVATSAWELNGHAGREDIGCRHRKDRLGHEALLRHLLQGRGGIGHAWIGRDKGGETVDYHLAGSAQATQTLADLRQDVDRLRGHVTDRVDIPMEERRERLREIRHRVVMDPRRLHAVTDPYRDDVHPDPDEQPPVRWVEGGHREHLVALDLRFDFYLDKPMCHVSVSIWSGTPWHERYRPPRSQEYPFEPDPWLRTEITVSELTEYVKRYHTVLRQLIDLLDCFMPEAELRAYGRKNVLPIFWVPMLCAAEGGARDRRILARELLGLGDPTDCVAASSIVSGEFDVMRRFVRGMRVPPPVYEDKHRRLSRAHYLIVRVRGANRPPGSAADDAASTAKLAALSVQEDRAAEVITSLTDVEGRGASYLHDVHRDLQILASHLAVYDKVAARAELLWDSLSTHIISQRRIHDTLRHAVELLHQVLQQGVGDVAELSNRASECVTRVDAATDQLHVDFDDRLTESHPGAEGLRAAIVRAGLFEKIAMHARHTEREANRIKAMYDDLLRIVGYEFDEWRVRESDVVQKLSGLLGGVLGLIGVVTVFDATVDLKPAGQSTAFGNWAWLTDTGVGLSWFVGGLLLIAIGWSVRRWIRSARLGSRGFRQQYLGRLPRDERPWRRRKRDPEPRSAWDPGDALWLLLRDTAPEAFASKADEPPGDWRRLDNDLAARFARNWDRVAATPEPPAAAAGWLRRMLGSRVPDDARQDIANRARQVERWALRSLLLTERTRQLHHYPLPRLTTLYLQCARMPGALTADPLAPARADHRPRYGPPPRSEPDPADLSEFALSMQQAGMSWEDAALLDQWLVHQRPTSAAEVLAVLDGLKVDATMTRDEITAMARLIVDGLAPGTDT